MIKTNENGQIEAKSRVERARLCTCTSETQSGSVLRGPLADSPEWEPNAQFASILALNHITLRFIQCSETSILAKGMRAPDLQLEIRSRAFHALDRTKDFLGGDLGGDRRQDLGGSP